MVGDMIQGKTYNTQSDEPRNRIIPPDDCGALPDPTAYYDEICLKAMRKLEIMLDAGEWCNSVHLAKTVSILMSD